jgi:hypothetical protein
MVINPPKAKQRVETSDMFAMLMQQNQELIAALSARLAPTEAPTEAPKKGGKNG